MDLYFTKKSEDIPGESSAVKDYLVEILNQDDLDTAHISFRTNDDVSPASSGIEAEKIVTPNQSEELLQGLNSYQIHSPETKQPTVQNISEKKNIAGLCHGNRSNDAGLWISLSENDISFWVENGQAKCQH